MIKALVSDPSLRILSMGGNKKQSPSKTLAEYPTKENEKGAKPKEKKRKKQEGK